MKTLKKTAIQRIHNLFRLARETIHEDPNMAQRYVEIARRISMRAKVRVPIIYRRLICKHCKSFIFPGVNCRVRIRSRREPHVVVTCLKCGAHMRSPLRRRERSYVV